MLLLLAHFHPFGTPCCIIVLRFLSKGNYFSTSLRLDVTLFSLLLLFYFDCLYKMRYIKCSALLACVCVLVCASYNDCESAWINDVARMWHATVAVSWQRNLCFEKYLLTLRGGRKNWKIKKRENNLLETSAQFFLIKKKIIYKKNLNLKKKTVGFFIIVLLLFFINIFVAMIFFSLFEFSTKNLFFLQNVQYFGDLLFKISFNDILYFNIVKKTKQLDKILCFEKILK